MFFCLPSSTTHSVGALSAVLTRFRVGVPPNMAQAVKGFSPAARLTERTVLRSGTLQHSGQESSSPADTFSLAADGFSVGVPHLQHPVMRKPSKAIPEQLIRINRFISFPYLFGLQKELPAIF